VPTVDALAERNVPELRDEQLLIIAENSPIKTIMIRKSRPMPRGITRAR
jgi:hypothetical protein